MRGYVLLRDDTDSTFYFQELGLGIFWACSPDVRRAYVFKTRASAAAFIRRHGKQRAGWRVISTRAAGLP
jgi:hypothetical protein